MDRKQCRASIGRVSASSAIDTHCPYCAMQCGVSLTISDGPPLLAPTEFPVNRGGLCAKGWTAADLLDHGDRLLSPLVRKDPGDRTSPLRPADWDEALDRVADAIRASQHRYGPDSVGAFGGGGLTNEKAYALGKFVRVALRSASIDYNGRFCMSSAATDRHTALGRLIGKTRAGLLLSLDEPASTTTLAHRHALAAGTVSEHLSVLRDAGFVAGQRHRHEIRYRRTPLGDAVLR
jgi:assimilatory nitrate reductase catalytic subunit